MAISRKRPGTTVSTMDKRHTKKTVPARVIAGSRVSTKPPPKDSKTKQSKITDFIKKKDGGTPIQHKKIDLNKVKFKQLNNNKREVSMDELDSLCSPISQFVCLGHEPSVRLGALVGLNKRHIKVHSLQEKPRAYIFTSANLHIWPMPSLTNKDVATALFDTHDPKIGKLVLCSFYWDILEKEIPEMFHKVAEFAKANGYILVTGSDTNAHSTLWNCIQDNTRGRKLEDFMIQADLIPVNTGNKKTFHGGMGSSIIDVTMVTTRFADRVKNWQVSNRNMLSDHSLIEFDIELEEPVKFQYIDFKNGDHKQFKKDCEEQAALLALELLNEDKKISLIEKRCNKLSSIIQANAKKHFKLKEVMVKPNYSKHITKDILAQGKIANKARNKHRKSKTFVKHNYDAWKKEEQKYTAMKKGAKKDFERGKTANIATRKDFDKMDKDLNYQNSEIALIKNSRGTVAASPEEALKNLCDIHFPTAIETTEETIAEAHKQYNNKNIYQMDHEWITSERIKLAIEKFEVGKAPGIDNIPPDLLAHIGPIVVEEIRQLFLDTVSASYTPTIWRQSKVIFIPKGGKTDYSIAKAYRPISLTPFLFKTLERLCFWHAHEKALEKIPIHKRQYAYRAGMGTETAISRVLDSIEKGMMKRQFAVGCFVDIASAFDKLNAEKATQALKRRGIDSYIVEWYGDYLRHRYATVELKGVKRLLKINTGCPQGGVLSTLLWSVAFDDLLRKFDIGKVTSIGYADDGSLIMCGHRLDLIFKELNLALQKCVEWAREYGLTLSEEKTSYIIFTYRKRNQFVIPSNKILLNGKEIRRDTSIKYLGVHLDQRLDWNTHVEEKTKQAKRVLFAMRSYCHKKWGPSPEMMKYAYTSRVRPILGYCAFAFSRHLTRLNLSKMKKVQRLALQMCGNFRQNTSGDSLDALTGTTPIELFLKEETLKAGTRLNRHFELSWVGTSKTSKAGHEEELVKELEALEIMNVESDAINTETVLKKNFTVNTDKGGFDYNWGYRMYTDGSKMKNGVGAGICYMRDDEVLLRDNIGLPPKANIFQAELKAIQLACDILQTHEIFAGTGKPELIIFSDSLSSLQALASTEIKNSIVKETHDMLNEIGRYRQLELHWIKAHNNYRGNEIADQEAKLGTRKPVEIQLPIPKREIRNIIEANTKKIWQSKWKTQLKSKTMERLMPELDLSLASQIMKLSRNDMSIAVQYLTGHNFLLHHEKKMVKGEDRKLFLNSKCRLCNREEETTEHMIFRCDALAMKRAATLGTYFLDPDKDQLNLHDVVEFIKTADLENHPIPEGHLTNLNPTLI